MPVGSCFLHKNTLRILWNNHLVNSVCRQGKIMIIVHIIQQASWSVVEGYLIKDDEYSLHPLIYSTKYQKNSHVYKPPTRFSVGGVGVGILSASGNSPGFNSRNLFILQSKATLNSRTAFTPLRSRPCMNPSWSWVRKSSRST